MAWKAESQMITSVPGHLVTSDSLAALRRAAEERGGHLDVVASAVLDLLAAADWAARNTTPECPDALVGVTITRETWED